MCCSPHFRCRLRVSCQRTSGAEHAKGIGFFLKPAMLSSVLTIQKVLWMCSNLQMLEIQISHPHGYRMELQHAQLHFIFVCMPISFIMSSVVFLILWVNWVKKKKKEWQRSWGGYNVLEIFSVLFLMSSDIVYFNFQKNISSKAAD